MRHAILSRLLAVGLALAPVACATTPAQPPLTASTTLDTHRMLGRWYIIANIPYSLEKGVVGSYVDYQQRPDGDIDEFYSGHDKSFAAKLNTDRVRDHVEGANNATWRGDFIWPFFFRTTWIHVDADYRVALLGYKDRSLGWVFSRNPTMDEATYRALLQRFAAQGYDVAKFQRVPQTPEQIGQPGFQ